METAIWTVVSIIATLIVSHIYHKKSDKIKKLSITYLSSEIVSESLTHNTKLQFLYAGQEITSLTNSTIKICNIGSDIVEDDDFYQGTPITIKASCPLLPDINDCLKITSSNTKASVQLKQTDNQTLVLIFEAIRPKDIITLNLTHSGTLSIDAALKSGKTYISETKPDAPIEDNKELSKEYKINFIFDKIVKMTIYFGLVFAFLSIFYPFENAYENLYDFISNYKYTLTFLLATSGVMIAMLFGNFKIYK